MSNARTTEFPVELITSSTFGSPNDGEVQGHIDSDHGQMIQGLLDEKTLQLYTSCSVGEDSGTRKSSWGTALLPCTLQITVYGPAELLDEIGPWFQDYDTYLQDPLVCHLDVKYINPQRLSASASVSSSCLLVSEVESRSRTALQLQAIDEHGDPLSALVGGVDLDEASQPTSVTTALAR